MELDCRANGTFHFWKTGEAAETGLSSCLMFLRPEAVCIFFKMGDMPYVEVISLEKKKKYCPSLIIKDNVSMRKLTFSLSHFLCP